MKSTLRAPLRVSELDDGLANCDILEMSTVGKLTVGNRGFHTEFISQKNSNRIHLAGESQLELNFIKGAEFLLESQGKKFFRISGNLSQNECGHRVAALRRRG